MPDPNDLPPPPMPAAWYHVVLSAIGDAVLTTDPDGLVTYLNPVAESLTGWPSAEALGRPLEEIVSLVNEGNRERAEQPVRKVIATGLIRGLANHTLLIDRDGGEHPIDDSAAPVWDEDGGLVGVVMVFRDIAERRRGEELVESARSFAESIVGTIREPLLVLEADLRVKSANRSFYEAFRVDPVATEGRLIYELGDGQWDIPGLRTLLEEIVPLNSAFENFEVDHDFESIGPRTMLLNARRFPAEGEWELILLAIADVTERKRLERERGAMLAEAEVGRARSEANEAELAGADRRKDEFIAILAHELRNPLATIGMAAYMLRGPGGEEDRGSGLDILDRQVKKLGRLIDDLLDVSRVSQGKVQLRKEPVDLAVILAHAVASTSAAIRDRGHELAIAMPPGPMMIDGDSTRLEQVFVNLLENAAKYTESGGRIRLIAEDGSSELVVRVSDDGVGIAAEMLPHLFGMFTQVAPAEARSGGGLGIGLSLVKDLVELHGGTVSAASEGLGRGSEFVVRVPRA